MLIQSVVALFILESVLDVCAGLKCYSCTYVFSGHDGSYNYECVNDPINFTLTRSIECQPGDSCIISGTYDEGFGKLLSLSRNCGKPTSATSRCNDVSTRPSCEYSCSTDLCNFINGDMKVRDDNAASRSFLSPVIIATAIIYLFL